MGMGTHLKGFVCEIFVILLKYSKLYHSQKLFYGFTPILHHSSILSFVYMSRHIPLFFFVVVAKSSMYYQNSSEAFILH